MGKSEFVRTKCSHAISLRSSSPAARPVWRVIGAAVALRLIQKYFGHRMRRSK